MSRFVEVEESLINVDHIVKVQRHKNYTLSIFLDDGNVVKVDCACGHIWKAIAGRDFIVSTAPCDGGYAAIDNEEGMQFYPVLQLGITGDGKVRPLCVQTDRIEFLDDWPRSSYLCVYPKDQKMDVLPILPGGQNGPPQKVCPLDL